MDRILYPQIKEMSGLWTIAKDNCSGKGLNIWLENMRKICLTLTSLALPLESRSINY
jgi:hypothetical protein